MAIAEALLAEFDHEMANTRRTLERVPMDKADWKPSEKAGTMGWLAAHVGTLTRWASVTIATDELDYDTKQTPPPGPKTSAELIAEFDKLTKEARASIAGASDEKLMGPWTFKIDGNALFTMPRVAVLRSFVMNHMIHHRGQLTVYLRLTGVPVPALYGPSGDEQQ